MLKRLFALTFFFFLLTSPGFACVCTYYNEPICSSVANADLVFVGRVRKLFLKEESSRRMILHQRSSIHHRDGLQEFRVVFEIETVFKGEIGKTIEIESSTGTSCETSRHDLKIGQVWTVYAYRSEESAQYLAHFGLCSRTRKGYDPTFLEDYRNGKTDEHIMGRITDISYSTIGGVVASVSGGDFHASATTVAGKKFGDPEGGLFDIRVPGPGRYEVSLSSDGLRLMPVFRIPPGSKFIEGADGNHFVYYTDVPKGLCTYFEFDSFRYRKPER